MPKVKSAKKSRVHEQVFKQGKSLFSLQIPIKYYENAH